MKTEIIRFVAKDEDEAYYLRTMHHLAKGCLLLEARDEAVEAVLRVMAGALRKGRDGRHSTSSTINVM